MPYLFTSESVSEGHPDKVADQISDALIDHFLAFDASSKVACETLVTTGQVVLAGEVKSKAYLDVQQIARDVIDMLEGVVTQAGTGLRASIPGYRVAGKTGTVQNPHGEDHSTFIGFGPVDEPKIAIAVYVENSGGGGKYAAPIASLIMEKYIRGEISDQRKYREKQIIETNLIEPKPMKVFAGNNPAAPAAPMDNTPVDAPDEEDLNQ